MRRLVATLQTLLGAFAGSVITLGMVSEFVLEPGSAAARGLITVALVLAGLSVVSLVALIIVQYPERDTRPHM